MDNEWTLVSRGSASSSFESEAASLEVSNQFEVRHWDTIFVSNRCANDKSDSFTRFTRLPGAGKQPTLILKFPTDERERFSPQFRKKKGK
jgi:hypothetical protein